VVDDHSRGLTSFGTPRQEPNTVPDTDAKLRNVKMKAFGVDSNDSDAVAQLEEAYEQWRSGLREESIYDTHFSTTNRMLNFVVLYTD